MKWLRSTKKVSVASNDGFERFTEILTLGMQQSNTDGKMTDSIKAEGKETGT